MDTRGGKTPKKTSETSSSLGFWSGLPFLWGLISIIKTYKNGISDNNPFEYLEEHEAAAFGDKLEQAWQEESHSKHPSLLKAILKVFGLRLAICGVLLAVWQLSLTTMQPLLIKALLENCALEQTEETKKLGYIYAFSVALMLFVRAMGYHSITLVNSVTGMRVHSACASLVYRKLLTLTRSNLEKITIGRIINLLSNDIKKLEFGFKFIHYLWITPVEIIVSIYIINHLFGHVALAGVAVLLLLFPLQVFLTKTIAVRRMHIAQKTDQRVRLMNEIVCGVQLIKMYTWEKPFAKLVELARRLELDLIQNLAMWNYFSLSTKLYMGRIAQFSLVVATVLAGTPLKAEYIFAVMLFYQSLGYSITMHLPFATRDIGEIKASMKRLENLLLCDVSNQKFLETTKPTLAFNNKKPDITETIFKYKRREVDVQPGIHAANIKVKWSSDLPVYSLDDISLNIGPKELIAIVGPAGSGKSTLFQVIMKEIEIEAGSLCVGGTMSYASQEPWIFSGSLKQNILFDQKFDSERYGKIIKVCALEHDLALFPYGDQTLVGERGVMLSGGQKARINLARAIYKDADIYLLDDPLSAVDARVSKQIFNECILEHLKNKCVVLVTHQLQYLGKVDRIYLLEEGEIAAFGSFEEVQHLKYFEKLSNENTESHASDSSNDTEDVGNAATKSQLPSEVKEQDFANSWKTLKKYFTEGGPWMGSFGVLALFASTQAVATSIDYFITFLINLEQEREHSLHLINETLIDFFTTEISILIYGVLLLILLVLCFTRLWTFKKFTMTAAIKLHNSMLNAVMRATMEFFNSNPSGRVLNRFSNDVNIADEQFSFLLFELLQVGISLVAISLFVCCLNMWMIIPTIVLFSVCIFFCVLFMKVNKAVSRTVANNRSPLLSYLTASLRGLTTIKVLGAEKTLIKEYDNHQDLHDSSLHLQMIYLGSFVFWIDMTCVIYAGLIICIFSLSQTEVFMGNIGVAIVQSMSYVGIVQYCLQNVTEVAYKFVSVERILEYSKMNPEPNEGTVTPSESWPSHGTVEFKSVSLKYEDHYALKQVAFTVQSGEKVGIVGRTGAGKSSLVSVLFRLSPFEGSIMIDGLDTKTIPLNDLRSKISIIPQDPFLFSGTLRKNVDPFDQYSDSQIWTALEEVELKKMVSGLSSGLDSVVLEGGTNISVGQKQLLCLARAILQNSVLIVLDEATANVDLMTDELIQSTIRRKFENSTVLTVAHRLHTVMDSDKILVMEDGTVAEFGHPSSLLKNSTSFFSEYVREYGLDVAQHL